MQKITPHLWFDRNTEEAMNFYVDVFNGLKNKTANSKIISISRYEKGIEAPGAEEMEGKVITATFELNGQKFMALDGGPIFKINPSISFFLNFDPSKDKNARENLDATWKRLSEGGKALMPLQKYPFSEHYGWIEDKYGVSWQLILTDPKGEDRPFIVPSLMFVGDVVGKAEEAVSFYLSVFKNSKRGTVARYPSGMEPDKEGTIMFSDFMIENQWFAAMDSAHKHKFAFNEAVSFYVECRDQKEVDYFWEKLSAFAESEQCGWLKDKYGVSWQIIPKQLGELAGDPDKKKSQRVINAMLKMKKIDIKGLKDAYEKE